MNPIALQIGSFTLRWYGVMAAAGLLLAGFLLNWNQKYTRMSKDQCSNALIIALVGGILGARIFYVVQFWHLYRNNLFEIIRIDRGGLVFYGGFILAILLLFVYARLRKIDFIRMLDLFTPAMAVAHACGRIGCFLNGCCFGRPTSLWLGVHYPAGSEPALRYGDAALHPVQLYEAAENLLFAGVYVILLRKCRRGVAISSYFIIYGVLRFLNEYARGDNPRIWGLFTPAQIIGIFLVTAGAGMLICFRSRHEQPDV